MRIYAISVSTASWKFIINVHCESKKQDSAHVDNFVKY